MRQDEAARVVLVRAIEETLPRRIPPEALLEAHAAAGDPRTGAVWIARRAAYLVEHVLGEHRHTLARTTLALPAPWAAAAAAALVGLASNYLGPSAQIHVLLNPIVVLVLWNLAVYGTLLARRTVAAPAATAEAPDVAPQPSAPPRPPARRAPGLVERLVLGRGLRWFLRVRARADETVDEARDQAAVGRRFAMLWWPALRPAAALWLRRLLHLCAIGVTAGAVLGMYVRGLFFAYRVVWRSTFVNDPGMVAFVLACLLGPAALLLGRPAPDRADVLRLLAPDGDPAAAWIHLYALSALLFVVVPRALLAAAARRRLRRVLDGVPVALDAPYYQDLLERAQAVSPEQLEASIRQAVRDECDRFAGRLAAFVCVALYDERVAPRLRAFREEGGTLRALEAALREECTRFAPRLDAELPRAQHELERGLVERVRRLMGEDGPVDLEPRHVAGDVGAASAHAVTHVGERVGADVAGMVAGVVSAAVGVVVGTITGGFGDALGLALLVGLVESGPLGWLIGAIGGIVATGAMLWLGREQLREGVKAVPLPAPVLRATLWSGRFERLIAEGRARCETAVREALGQRMEPLAASLGERVWRGLRPMLGELQRPRAAPA